MVLIYRLIGVDQSAHSRQTYVTIGVICGQREIFKYYIKLSKTEFTGRYSVPNVEKLS